MVAAENFMEVYVRKALVPLLAPVVVLLQIAEAALCLDILRNTGRWKDYIAGLLESTNHEQE